MQGRTRSLLSLIGTHILAFAALLYLFLDTHVMSQVLCLLGWLALVLLSQMLARRTSYRDRTSIGNGYLTVFGVLMPGEWLFVALLWGKSHSFGTTVLMLYLGAYFLNPFAFPRFLPKVRVLGQSSEEGPK